MKIRCKNCGYKEKVNKNLLFKVMGISSVGFGGYAWLTYRFAGTGRALPIVIAIITWGVITAAFSDQITKFFSKNIRALDAVAKIGKVLFRSELQRVCTIKRGSYCLFFLSLK